MFYFQMKVCFEGFIEKKRREHLLYFKRFVEYQRLTFFIGQNDDMVIFLQMFEI